MSRLRFLFAFAAALALAAGFAACGGSDNSDESPQVVIENATFEGVESADLDLTLKVKASGKEGGDLDVTLSGPFEGEGEGELPQLDLDAKATGSLRGDDVDFEGGLVLLPSSAYVNYEGTEYEVDPTTFSFVESALEQAQQQGDVEGQSPAATACQEAAAELDVASFADNLVNDGTVDVGGTSTTKLSGDLDVPGALDALIELSEDPACKSQLGAAGPLPSPAELKEAEDEISSAVKTAHVDLYVGDDDIIRRLTLDLDVAPRGSGSPEDVQIALDLTLSGVNEEQEISAPTGAKPLSGLFQKLGVNPLELLGALEGKGLGDLLEGLGGGSSSGGGQSYSDCLKDATTALDLQRCASRL